MDPKQFLQLTLIRYFIKKKFTIGIPNSQKKDPSKPVPIDLVNAIKPSTDKKKIPRFTDQINNLKREIHSCGFWKRKNRKRIKLQVLETLDSYGSEKLEMGDLNKAIRHVIKNRHQSPFEEALWQSEKKERATTEQVKQIVLSGRIWKRTKNALAKHIPELANHTDKQPFFSRI